MSYDAYRAFLSMNQLSNNAKNYHSDYIQTAINDRFDISPDYKVIEMLDRDTLESTSIGVRLTKPKSMNGSSDLKDDYFKVLFKNFNTVISIGDLFEFDNFRWLVTDVSNINQLTQSCMIERCNAKLKFIESNNDVLPTITNDIISIDCVAEKKIYDPERDRYYNLPNEDVRLKVANNSNSRKIKFGVKGTGTRFLLGNPAYAYDTTGVDSVSMVRTDINSSNEDNGILLIRLTLGRLNEREDNITENVAKQRCFGGV